MAKRILLCAALLAASVALSAQKTVSPPSGGKAISNVNIERVGHFYDYSGRTGFGIHGNH